MPTRVNLVDRRTNKVVQTFDGCKVRTSTDGQHEIYDSETGAVVGRYEQENFTTSSISAVNDTHAGSDHDTRWSSPANGTDD